jgi:CubicO group peptidase (beta-lactamase class C family)
VKNESLQSSSKDLHRNLKNARTLAKTPRFILGRLWSFVMLFLRAPNFVQSGGEFMRRMVVLAFFAVFLVYPQQTYAGQVQADEINTLIAAAHKVGVFNGTVLVGYKGKVIYEASLGFADSTRTRALSNESRYYIGSIEKEFSGAGLLLLAQQGKLKLENKVSEYFPDYP